MSWNAEQKICSCNCWQFFIISNVEMEFNMQQINQLLPLLLFLFNKNAMKIHRIYIEHWFIPPTVKHEQSVYKWICNWRFAYYSIIWDLKSIEIICKMNKANIIAGQNINYYSANTGYSRNMFVKRIRSSVLFTVLTIGVKGQVDILYQHEILSRAEPDVNTNFLSLKGTEHKKDCN